MVSAGPPGQSKFGVIAVGKLDRPLDTQTRRGEPRRTLALTTTAIQEQVGPRVEVLNISASGMLLQTDARLSIEEGLMVVLPEAGEREAQIVWTSEDLYGCRFAQKLTKAELSAIELRSRPISESKKPTQPQQMNDETFGQRLKRLRMASRYSMVGLAAATGVTKPTLWKWETERVRPRQKALANLASVLNVSESYLLFGIGDGEAGLGSQETANLAETIAHSRSTIAELAGVSTDKVSIDIDFG
ncbi:helix-turn-helix domain-containing protein [Erythrobacter litoralis]|uniref:helix-turn-helix domain-containing protein n=1 Tax=Erythrobacter litoralis TaxID=39960 RepID=UPI002434D00C|nr:helix-turn-helix domain-containing protein [Erythrobacter litoralis]MDG6079241.1 helix-turn-helix domain-containing protein [Erythrobacter litoralis]